MWNPRIAASALAMLSIVACRDPQARIDPEDPEGRDLGAELRALDPRLRSLSLGSLIAASAGVTSREAPAVLSTWLQSTAGGRLVLDRWPRSPDGTPDLDRAPVAVRDARDLRAQVDRASHARCGEVSVVLRGIGLPAVRARLALPATSRACRSAGAGSGKLLEGLAAVEALEEAIEAGVTMEPVQPVGGAETPATGVTGVMVERPIEGAIQGAIVASEHGAVRR